MSPRAEAKRERFPHGNDAAPEALQGRWAMLEAGTHGARERLPDATTSAEAAAYAANIEDLVGAGARAG